MQDRLFRMYGAGRYDVYTKRAIIRYMLRSVEDIKGPKPHPHAAKGRVYLRKLRAKDPKTYEDAKRFLFQ